MSLAFESPTRGNGANEAYFTPLNMPSILNNNNNGNNNSNSAITGESNTVTANATSTVNTPYYTAPINPALHQDFLNAIQARHATQTTVMTPTILSPSLPNSGGFNLNTGSLANRRQAAMSSKSSNGNQVSPIDSTRLNQLLESSSRMLVLDVRSFVQYSHSRICTSINVSIPNTILKRPTFTLDKVYEAIVLDQARERLKSWELAESIVFYDQQSQVLQDNSASAYLGAKLTRAGFKGKLYYLKGGFEAFSSVFKENCESNATSPQPPNNNFGPPTIGGDSFPLKLPSKVAGGNGGTGNGMRPKLRLNNMPAMPTLGPFTAPMPQFENQAFNPFFSNIRQNMELSHGPIRERFPIRLPSQCNVDPNNNDHVFYGTTHSPRCVAGGHVSLIKNKSSFKAPEWLQRTIGESGAQLLAETYEKLERTEQRRLQNIMHFHSKHTDNPNEFPFSIVAGIEMGALNRYTNIWPFEYTRVKLRENKNNCSDYINASYVQYIDSDETASDARPDQTNTKCVKIMKECPFKNTQPYRRYISTQGPLPATFNDFWQVAWEQNSRVLVMLTKEEEMNKIKCHRYWPTALNTPTQYGEFTITLTDERVQAIKTNDNESHNQQSVHEDDVIIIRQLTVTKGGDDTSRKVTHLQYTGWMDFGVPDNPLGTLQIIQMADKTQLEYDAASLPEKVGPMIVHCSAGCGRSGAFCAIDTVLYRLKKMKEEEKDDTNDILLQTISRFREQRLSMVQTLRQFVFCYEAIWWWFLGYGEDESSRTVEDQMDTSL
ncbi:MAG: protein-tyrosine phosphatase-like protein [Benjaminiella poitrasii]|nr:MAG: protein-tyrosine phosphatase-like protein [Benjaminiella poitrasii]